MWNVSGVGFNWRNFVTFTYYLLTDSPEIVYSNNDGTFITMLVYGDNNQVDVHFSVKGNPIPSVDMKKNVTNSDDYKLEDVHIRNVTVHSEVHSILKP